MSKKTYQPWDIEKAIHVANGFEKIATLSLDSESPPTFDIAVASGVNFGIAIELNLKIIFYLDKGYLNDLTTRHNLAKIYDELSPNVKENLHSEFRELSKSFDSQTLEIISSEQDILRGYFAYAEKICVKWRYFGLDSKQPPVSGFVQIYEFLKILKLQISMLKQRQ